MQKKVKGKKDNNKIIEFANLLKNSNYTVVLTGAGMSTESGIPDFRSIDGLWKGIDPTRVASREALIYDYDTFYEFYKMRVKNLENCSPHKGYDILANWEWFGLINSIVTQNVDDFHIISGNKQVYRVHGTINEFSCVTCNESASKNMFLNKEKCSKCGSNLRPNVVLFGESLPMDELDSAIDEIKKADLLIVIGTSLSVSPINQLVNMTYGRKVYINNDINSASTFDLTFSDNAGDLLQAIDNIIIDLK